MATPVVVAGAIGVAHEVLAALGPVKFQVGAPVGAREPITPVTVAV